jgi:hypothetical protein
MGLIDAEGLKLQLLLGEQFCAEFCKDFCKCSAIDQKARSLERSTFLDLSTSMNSYRPRER